MKILYVGNAQGFDNAAKYYLIPQKLINGFTRDGHNVYVFNDRDYARPSNVFHSSKFGIKAVNRKMIEICEGFSPDLIVLGHCKHITNDTLATVRARLPAVKIIYRNVDPLHSPKNVADIRSRVGIVDGIFITTAGKALKQFAHEKTFVAYMPNPTDQSIETGRAFEKGGDIDLFFAGSFLRDQHDHRNVMLRRLQSELSDMNVAFFGSGLGERKVFGQEYLDTLANSRMSLCLSKTSDYLFYSSDRMAQLLGQGSLVFIDRGPRFDRLFGDDEMVFYDDLDDLIKKIRYFHEHDDERKAIAKKGWEKAHAIYDSMLVASFMVEKTFGLNFSHDYAWLGKDEE